MLANFDHVARSAPGRIGDGVGEVLFEFGLFPSPLEHGMCRIDLLREDGRQALEVFADVRKIWSQVGEFAPGFGQRAQDLGFIGLAGHRGLHLLLDLGNLSAHGVEAGADILLPLARSAARAAARRWTSCSTACFSVCCLASLRAASSSGGLSWLTGACSAARIVLSNCTIRSVSLSWITWNFWRASIMGG